MFCYECGKIGHMGFECERAEEGVDDDGVKQYGDWLCASLGVSGNMVNADIASGSKRKVNNEVLLRAHDSFQQRLAKISGDIDKVINFSKTTGEVTHQFKAYSNALNLGTDKGMGVTEEILGRKNKFGMLNDKTDSILVKIQKYSRGKLDLWIWDFIGDDILGSEEPQRKTQYKKD
ncbi:hypothetical protein PTKIN_Ptkin17bG0094000 [Pterospermum kingtungense]